MLTEVKENVPLKSHTVFKLGGTARFFVEAKSREALLDAIEFAKMSGVPFFVAGAGSNILVSDKGFDGLFIKNSASGVAVDGSRVTAESGVMMPYVSSRAAETGLSGLEWGVGVPGTIGGSVRGNAGCFGMEVKDTLESAEVYDAASGDIRIFSNLDCRFGYRDSIFKHQPEFIVISAVFALRYGDERLIHEKMLDMIRRRSETQDVGAKCAGCIFKNVSWARRDINKEELLSRFPVLQKFESAPGISAGFLIDEAGLKGKKIGGAVISGKHANFFINAGDASAENVMMLIAIAKERVHGKFGLLLEEEIQYLGFDFGQEPSRSSSDGI